MEFCKGGKMYNVVEIDCETGIETVRELTAEEIAAREEGIRQFNEQQAAYQAELESKAEAKASAEAKLAALGLTAEEISAIIS
jgi:hypothetical protein